MVAAAIVGAGVVGAAASSAASSRASRSADAATRAQSQAASDSVELGYEQLDFDKQVYADGAPARAAAEKRAQEVSDAQLASMRQNNAISQDYYDYSKSTFRPVEQKLVADAQQYDTTGRRQQAAAEATADVESAFGSAQDATTRAIRRTGGSTGGRAQALMQDFALQKAKSITGATTGAVRNVENQGYARMVDAASLGRGLAANQATSASVATNAGNSSVNASMQAIAAQQSGAGLVNQGYSGAMSGLGQAGSLYGQAASNWNDSAANSARQAATMAAIAGRTYASGGLGWMAG